MCWNIVFYWRRLLSCLNYFLSPSHVLASMVHYSSYCFVTVLPLIGIDELDIIAVMYFSLLKNDPLLFGVRRVWRPQ